MFAAPKTTQAWVLKNKPAELPTFTGSEPTFALQKVDLPPLQDGQVLVRTTHLSNDPAQRGWIDANMPRDRLYVTPVEVGDAMRSRGLGEVISTKSDKIRVGTIVRGNVNWRQYTILDENAVYVIQPLANGLDPAHYLGALGNTGLTAYYGLMEVAKAQQGDRIVVSGAAGATGSMVVQIAKKLAGAAQVIGIAGSDEKCRWVEKLGADLCELPPNTQSRCYYFSCQLLLTLW